MNLIIGILLFHLFRNLNKRLLWIIVSAFVALFTVIFRIGIVYSEVVLYLPNLNCFSIRDLSPFTYVLFFISGAFSGFVISLQENDNLRFKIIGITGVILGIIYHIKIAESWYSSEIGTAVPLFLGEFLAPTFLLGLIWVYKFYDKLFKEYYKYSNH